MSAPVFRVGTGTAAAIVATLPTFHVNHRPRGCDAQSVLRTLAGSWKSVPGHLGPHADLTVDQLAESTMLSSGTVRDCLAVLRRAGLLLIARRGGGRGAGARATIYHLALGQPGRCPTCADPVEELRGVDPAQLTEELRGVEAETARGGGRNCAGSAPHLCVNHSVLPLCTRRADCQCDRCHPPGCQCTECAAGRRRIAPMLPAQLRLDWWGDLDWYTPRNDSRIGRPPPAADGTAERTGA